MVLSQTCWSWASGNFSRQYEIHKVALVSIFQMWKQIQGKAMQLFPEGAGTLTQGCLTSKLELCHLSRSGPFFPIHS